ncbi:MAG: InlB B-repeat-containing protein [Oscillospiraceae bacterium]|nr:InlB B-repeat-containing protein [Oscillospiraceae bacterium]MBQ7129716.1 InlB B-repeat-containing protein [Oscillospiraceae bacterium]
MKTVCKKLLCLMLVAMLLVSAVPAAFATELIVPIGPGDDDGQVYAEEESGIKVSLVVYDKDDNAVESKGPVEIEDGDLKAWQEGGNAMAAEILEVFGSKYTADQVKSVAVMGNSVVIVLNVAEGGVGGEVAAEYTLTVNTGSGSYRLTVYEGQRYSDALAGKEPARPGQNFLGWKSENLGTTIRSSDVIEGDDTVVALWSAAIKYNITFIDERGTEPEVVKAKQVSYGSAIGTLPVPSDRKGYVFVGWKLNGKLINAETIYELQGDSTAYATWKLESDEEDVPMNGGHEKNGKVWLEIYVNGDTSDLVKRVNITDYADDDKITQAEVEKVAKKHVVAKSGYSLKFEGLFDEESWWWYTRDEETDGDEYIIVNRDDGDDYVYVMVKNVKKAVADSSNPKTGDDIMIAVTTMGLAAVALVSIVELKKRKMI